MKIKYILTVAILAFALGSYENCSPAGSGSAFNLNSGASNSSGTLGSLTPPASPTPSPTPAGMVTAIAATYGTTCAIVTTSGSGAAKCWGSGTSGLLGNGMSSASSFTAVQVNGATSGVTQINSHRSVTCATVNGNALCWGLNSMGQLGDGGVSPYGPVQPTGLPGGVVKVLVGYEHACALVNPGGNVYCWGAENFGEIGNGTQFGSKILPLKVFSGASDLALNDETTCAIAGGFVYCWGSNWYGSAGQPNFTPNGSNYMAATPTFVSGFAADAMALTSGSILSDQICALLTDSETVKCWGEGAIGGTTDTNVPTLLFSLATPITKLIGHQGGGACAIAGGQLMCQTQGGSLTTVSGLNTPIVDYSDDSDAITGSSTTAGCAVSAAGTAQCWGNNTSGELGTGSTTPSSSTTPLTVTVVP